MPKVVLSESGSAIAVWFQYNDTCMDIWSNRYDVNKGWGVAQLIETNDSGRADDPQVAIDSHGNAIAVWCQSDGVRWNIYANRYAVGKGWGIAQLLETNDSGDADGPQVSMNSRGDAFVVWVLREGEGWGSDEGGSSVCANRYVAGKGWETACRIEAQVTGDPYVFGPQVGVDDAGNAIAVWEQWDGTWDSVYSNRYSVGSGWGTAQLIETNDSYSVTGTQLGVDGAGNAIAIWCQRPWMDIHANRYSVGDGWGTAEIIQTHNDQSGNYNFDPQLAVNEAGNAIVIWYQTRSGSSGLYFGYADIYSCRYVIGAGWAGAELVETSEYGVSMWPQVAIDGSGNCTAVWLDFSTTRLDAYSSRYVAGSGWEAAILMSTNESGNASYVDVAADSTGNVIVVWNQRAANYIGAYTDAWAIRYAVAGEPSESSMMAIGVLAVVIVALAVPVAYVLMRRRKPPKTQQQM
jgi:hypothetical protein